MGFESTQCSLEIVKRPRNSHHFQGYREDGWLNEHSRGSAGAVG